MALFIPVSYCAPKPGSGTDWALWYKASGTACEGPQYLYVSLAYSNAGEGSLRVEAFGRVYEQQRLSGVNTECLTDPYFVAGSPIAGGTGVGSTNTRIDVWKAFRDGLWSGSTQVVFKANATRAATITGAFIGSVDAVSGGTSRLILSGSTGAAMGTPAPGACAGATTPWYSITISEDGSISEP